MNTAERNSTFMGKEEMDAYMQEYIGEDASRSIILSENFRRPMDPRKLNGNNNVLVVGSAGSGKTRSVIVPNILQMNASYVVTDPSGEIARCTGQTLKENGYKVRILDLSCRKGGVPGLSDMGDPAHYNPLSYIRDEAGVRGLAGCLISNTQEGEAGKSSQFFTQAEELLYTACIHYLKDHSLYDNRKNLSGLKDMLCAPLGLAFGNLPCDSTARKYYETFCKATGRTQESVIASCVARLQSCLTPQVADLTDTDDLHLEKMGEEKTALFIITPQADRSCSFLVSMLYHQLLETLWSVAEPLKVPVSCMMDEFANYGKIPDFPLRLALMRMRNISATIAVQSIPQIEAMYENDWRTLVGNCSTVVFSGSGDPVTLEFFSRLLGTCSVADAAMAGRTVHPRKALRRVMTPEELMRLSSDECIVLTWNLPAVRDRKYACENHPHYRQASC